MTARGVPRNLFSTEQALQADRRRAAAGPALDALANAEAELRHTPGSLDAHRRAASALTELARYDEALAHYDRLLALAPSDAAAWCSSGHVARQGGDSAGALVRIMRACRLEPGNPKYAYARRVLSGTVVPSWHFSMLNDDARTRAYADALTRQIKPDHVVLEIGTGAGLLAMLAARAGAKHVYTCEANPALAAAAADIIARNGLADRVTVFPKMSTQLAVGPDLPDRADVLLSELFSPQLLSEEAIPTLNDAFARLVKPGAIVLPRRAGLRGVLIDGTPPRPRGARRAHRGIRSVRSQ
jgi:predicted O-methyltransferase YrrM